MIYVAVFLLLAVPSSYADAEEQVRVLQNQVNYLTSQQLPQQLQSLEVEVQSLRGQVEQLRHQLKQVASAKTSEKQAPFNDQQVYKAAIDALQKKQYAQASDQLQKILTRMPKSTYVPNVHYWLGEIDLLYNRYTQAMSHFQQVLEKFPNHNKVPDSLLKLSVAEVEIGRHELAEKHLKRILDEFPRSSAAHMARMQLTRLEGVQQGTS